MKYTLKYILPLLTLTVSLTAIPDQYMPYVDPFVYTLQHADMYPAVNSDISLTVTPETLTAINSSPRSGTDTTLYTTSPTFAIAQVNDYVNVRSVPSTDGEIVGKLYNGAVAQIQATAGPDKDWFQIVSGNVTGYIKAEYFLTGEKATAVMDTYVKTYATILADRLNVRKEASTDAKRTGYLEEAEQVLVLEDLGEWLHIQYTDTTNGYIAKEYTQLAESYIYALSAEEEATQRTIYKTRASRIQTAETTKLENTKLEFPATTYTSNEELRKAIVENAMQYVGDKYVHGGNSLETGTDCSGFTMLILAQYGYSISRTPSGQYSSAGRSIDYSEIQPGDIICYTSNGSSCTHVAFYIGDGQIVHAANSRKGVIVGKADYSTIIGIKNVID
ncbi:MAG: SH3 domain-containing protein [Lachnospiraceae bacterium]|nr:SH3 domain-containing protein [Lachnospiraceae bacterium]